MLLGTNVLLFVFLLPFYLLPALVNFLVTSAFTNNTDLQFRKFYIGNLQGIFLRLKREFIITIKHQKKDSMLNAVAVAAKDLKVEKKNPTSKSTQDGS